jgi:hypothetical protein
MKPAILHFALRQVATGRALSSLSLAAGLACGPCQASNPAAWSAVAGASEASLHTEERLPDGSLFNSERGRVTSRSAAITRSGDPASVSVAWQRSGGLLAYSGRTQFGVPLFTQTHWVHEQWSARFTPRFALPLAGAELQFPIGLARQRLDRSIRATPISTALQETLRIDELRVGAAMQLPLGASPWRVGVALQVHQPWAQSLRVDAGASFAPATLSPGRRVGWQAGVEAIWQPLPALALKLGWAAQHWRFGPSDSVGVTQAGVPVGSIRYPGSRQRQEGWQGQVAVGF